MSRGLKSRPPPARARKSLPRGKAQCRPPPPDEEAKKDFPSPKEGESFSVVLHPAYLEKSDYNTVSEDIKSEDYTELKKSIELNGVKDPVLARIGENGTLRMKMEGMKQKAGRRIIAGEAAPDSTLTVDAQNGELVVR